MANLARTNGSSGALFEINGTVPTGATWSEDIYFTDNAVAMDLTGLDFKMTFRKSSEDSSAEITLSIDAGTLSIVEDADAGVDRILRISVPADTLAGYEGDYISDLASQDGAGTVTLWAHGIITFRNNPVSF